MAGPLSVRSDALHGSRGARPAPLRLRSLRRRRPHVPGLNYAVMQARSFARHLLQRFEFQLSAGYKPSWSLLPIAKPKDGLPLELKPI